MHFLVYDSPAAPRPFRKNRGGRSATARLAVLGLLAGVGMTGCNRGPAGLVAVSGKLTLDGHAWAKTGQINFSPVKPAPGHPILPAMARVNQDGSFAILTPAAPGLMPGEYSAAVRCWETSPDDRHAGKSAIPRALRQSADQRVECNGPRGLGAHCRELEHHVEVTAVES